MFGIIFCKLSLNSSSYLNKDQCDNTKNIVAKEAFFFLLKWPTPPCGKQSTTLSSSNNESNSNKLKLLSLSAKLVNPPDRFFTTSLPFLHDWPFICGKQLIFDYKWSLRRNVIYALFLSYLISRERRQIFSVFLFYKQTIEIFINGCFEIVNSDWISWISVPTIEKSLCRPWTLEKLIICLDRTSVLWNIRITSINSIPIFLFESRSHR